MDKSKNKFKITESQIREIVKEALTEFEKPENWNDTEFNGVYTDENGAIYMPDYDVPEYEDVSDEDLLAYADEVDGNPDLMLGRLYRMNENQLVGLIRKSINEIWAYEFNDIDRLYDDYLNRNRVPTYTYEMAGSDIIEALSKISDPYYGFNDEDEANNILKQNGIDPNDTNTVKEFIISILQKYIKDEYSITEEDKRYGEILDDGGLKNDIESLANDYNAFFGDVQADFDFIEEAFKKYSAYQS